MSDTKRPSRRDFLKGSTAAAASAALAGGLSVGRTAHAQGSDVIKVALIGCGGRGRGAVVQQMNADKGVRLIAVADAFEAKAADAVRVIEQKHPDNVDVPPDRVFSGLTAYKQALATDAELVVLATPPGFRPPQYWAAVQAGKQIFMEKPCCVDAPGYRILLEANKLADDKGLMVGVGLQRRHESQYKETIAKIHDGAIGQVMFTRVYWNGQGIWNRLRTQLAEVLGREPTEMEYQVWNW